ncbi:hypothetical protein SUGI_0360050 [Cryptomeria japonica]|uniref:disease resistance RPP13-like protein 4 n=1 Tax=Cryptomeria japonica TaxID=3369 RepID=UPI002408F0AD|nr:disease resistance RPP13-like protein 4 [Cryptomeria japonica]GLJ19863.1 hypothetical protein SUGI_0360050 [Cryptomeria japonica]
MESAMVALVVEKLGKMVIEQINKEASLVLSFREDFEWLSNKLTRIRSYLREADLRSAHNESVKSWLLDVAEIALDAEDILDECAVQSEGTDNESAQSSCVCAFSYSQLVFRYKMARRIKDVKDRMRSILIVDAKELKLVGDVTHSNQPSTSTAQNVNWRGFNMIERDSHPAVAIESKVEQVSRLLDDPAAPVIAVVGMGGVGKTFLMQNVFSRIKDKFEKSIWLAISQTYSLKKLQAALARELDLDDVVNERVDEVKAQELIHGRLASTKFLIVLDDVWRATEQENLVLALGIPRGNNPESKIVVTTRSRHVSSNMNARVYELQTLSKEESWNLFCAFAFKGNQPTHHLEGIARQVEGECGKLPLAVKIVAASLANTTLSREWESKLQQLRAASSTEDPIMQILKLSYDSLPAHLKPCFVYLSFFPEDEEIDYQYLINLWVAEGYIPQGDDQLDIGWSYICHLQSLCLVERVHAGVGEYGYGVCYRRFKLHDLLLDLAMSIAKESQCAFSVEEAFKKDLTVQTGRTCHRILMGKRSIGDDDVKVMVRNRAYSASYLRTISFSKNLGIQNIPPNLINGARVLRVLDLSGTGISALPNCVGNLKLLRVLNLNETNITEVPECVKSIKGLRFLDISFCMSLEQFPKWIGELNSLEHLDIRQYIEKSMPKGISKLVSLQVLKLTDMNKLSVEDNDFLQLQHFVNLVNLRELLISIHHEAELKSIEDGILASLVKVRNLIIQNVTTDNCPPVSEKMLAMKDLESLSLIRFAVPNWICGFSNLMELKLSNCHCVEYPALEIMPSLITLYLSENSNCKALPKGFGKPGGFPKLRVFEIIDFVVLEELPELEDGAMPRLEILQVLSCENLKKHPCGLELLKSLKECHLYYMKVTQMSESGELLNKLKANNPNVKIYGLEN